jgi:hypothetical protein
MNIGNNENGVWGSIALQPSDTKDNVRPMGSERNSANRY